MWEGGFGESLSDSELLVTVVEESCLRVTISAWCICGAL